MTQGIRYRRAAFIAYEPGGYPDKKRVIPFRFNPETLSRQLTIEQGESGQGTEGAEPSGGGAATEQNANASSGPLKQSFNVLARFDFADRYEASKEPAEEHGVAPEIAALEDLMYGYQSESSHKDDGSEPVKQSPQRPTVLFVWGPKRVWPVRITAMTINETVFNTELNPVRAEIEVSLEVLGEADAKDNRAVSTALEFMEAHRKKMADLFKNTTASQTSDLPDKFK